MADLADFLREQASLLEKAHPESVDALDIAFRLRIRAARLLLAEFENG